MLRALVTAFTVLLVAPVLAGCSTDAPPATGDCAARVRWEGTVYRGHNELAHRQSVAASLGPGEVVGCGEGDAARRVDDVVVSSVEDVSPATAVLVERGPWRGIYVAQDVPRSAWPTALASAAGSATPPTQ